jgi:hypothetical protein
MPHKVKVSGSRSLKKGSKNSSKKQSKSKRGSKRSSKHAGMDFTAILDDMSNKTSMANMMGPQQMQNQMTQPDMQMDPNMMQQQAAMQGQMMDPNMMMMGKNSQGAQEQEIDPLHIQYIVPQNKNLNINNYGISYDQLLKGSQHNGLSDTFTSNNAQQRMNNVQQKMDEMKVN